MRAPMVRAILGGGGSGGMLPQKMLKSRVPQMRFLHFPGEILQKKILLLRITYTANFQYLILGEYF